ncbi:MAG TPA: hypothetical protein VJU78_17090 [Chitinophagaceae bacterium]|nr:hypothetical protein [Chitinophagaceae bacterium]
MKKYMIPAIALVMIAGMANAQTQKQPATATTAKSAPAKKTVAKSNTSASTASVTPKNSQEKNAATAINRKHHHKKGKTKVENK